MPVRKLGRSNFSTQHIIAGLPGCLLDVGPDVAPKPVDYLRPCFHAKLASIRKCEVVLFGVMRLYPHRLC